MQDTLIPPICDPAPFGGEAHVVMFESDAPVAHLTRALFELDRVGFALLGLSVQAEPLLARVTLAFAVRGAISAANYAARLERMPGVGGVNLAPAAS